MRAILPRQLSRARVVTHFVDLHAHYLPALDDGATSREMSMQMVRAVASLGFVELFATPHQRSGMFMPAREAIASAFAAVSADVAAQGPAVRLGLGAENFWDDVLHGRLREQHRSRSTADGPAFLFEVHPQFMPAGLENELFQLRVAGHVAGHGAPRALRRRSSATSIWPNGSAATPC